MGAHLRAHQEIGFRMLLGLGNFDLGVRFPAAMAAYSMSANERISDAGNIAYCHVEVPAKRICASRNQHCPQSALRPFPKAQTWLAVRT
jgi:hypothetical protein